MKKLIAVCMVLGLLLSCAAAETIDLSSMSYADLLKLQHQVAFEIIGRPEWKQVTVPPGTWRVGDDIPAGYYSITTSDRAYVCVWLRNKDDFSDNGLYYNEILTADKPCGKIILKTGMLVVTDNPVIFAPPMSLGF